MTELSRIPERFSAGTSVTYRRTFASYRADDGWEMSLFLRGPSILTQVADLSGPSFLVTITPEVCSLLLPGTYRWVERVTDGNAVIEPAGCVGSLVVDPDINQVGELVSWAEKTLAVIEARLSNNLTDGIADYQILGRAVSRIPITELMRIRSYCLSQIRQRRTGRFFRPIRAHFLPPQ